MTTTSETATVEVLTAEVRVLQVGRRQVTLSVLRQLDRVEPGFIEPFGRVHDPADQVTVVEVVGRDRRTGALVHAWVTPAREGYPETEQTEEEAIAREWAELPLIVLAGLR